MKGYADLEVGLHQRDADNYDIELRFSQPESDADVRLGRGGPSLARFDLEQLHALSPNDAAYGQLLSKSLFADPDAQTTFAQARSVAQTLDVPLRLRLLIGPSAPKLHDLHWETLCDPQDGSFLLTGEHILFSRYLSSLDWQPVRLRPQAELHALVVIANPADLAEHGPRGRALAPVDMEGELERAESSLGDIPITSLPSGGSATLNNIITHLRDGIHLHNGHDIFYLVCHGALVRGKPRLWLEDQAGKVAVVDGSELITRLRELRQRPRLVVLASCQSAGSGTDARSDDEGALAALGPRLAEAGIPAVLAMQGNIAMQTVAQFMPAFFHELQQDGQIDRAMAVARGMVRDRSDWWVPTLFLRLRSGRLWYIPGFGDEEQEWEKWPDLYSSIQNGRCTPILGPGLTEPLIGSRQEIAQRWAKTYNYPMSPYDCEDMPQVAQYLAVNHSYMFLCDELDQHLRQEILHRHQDNLPDGLNSSSLDDLITAAGTERWRQDAAEPHQVLAQLPLPIYITTDPSNLLGEALKVAGKDPQIELCRWNEDMAGIPSIYDDEPNYRPTKERPLVYHLFGQIQEPDSLVLTEDDYFDYLIGVTKDNDLIPGVVRRALTDTALLFLGFRMDDWNFRVLFRSIMKRQGGRRRRGYAHVAAQIDPEEGRILEPERARRYLESYFEDAHISIYWGSVEDFTQELLSRWPK